MEKYYLIVDNQHPNDGYPIMCVKLFYAPNKIKIMCNDERLLIDTALKFLFNLYGKIKRLNVVQSLDSGYILIILKDNYKFVKEADHLKCLKRLN